MKVLCLDTCEVFIRQPTSRTCLFMGLIIGFQNILEDGCVVCLHFPFFCPKFSNTLIELGLIKMYREICQLQ